LGVDAEQLRLLARAAQLEDLLAGGDSGRVPSRLKEDRSTPAGFSSLNRLVMKWKAKLGCQYTVALYLVIAWRTTLSRATKWTGELEMKGAPSTSKQMPLQTRPQSWQSGT
jgi:hypothetical protein